MQPWLVPEYPPLKSFDPVGKASVDGQIVYYPKVVRTMTDEPIPNQAFGLVSFMLFKEPRTFKTGKPCYGYFKIRGNWADKDQAIFQGSKIVREVDSRFSLLVAPVGHWLPITEEDAFVKEKIDIKDETDTRNEALLEKQKERKMIMREIREREEELKTQGDIYDDPKSLKYYSMRRVTELRLTESRDKAKRQLEDMEKTLKKVRVELKKLEKESFGPEYRDKWIDVYNEERAKGGIPPFKPSENMFKEYDEFTLSEVDVKNQK